MQTEHSQQRRLNTLKQLYIGKHQQLSKANLTINCFKYQILYAELLVIKASIPEDELPLGYE